MLDYTQSSNKCRYFSCPVHVSYFRVLIRTKSNKTRQDVLSFPPASCAIKVIDLTLILAKMPVALLMFYPAVDFKRRKNVVTGNDTSYWVSSKDKPFIRTAVLFRKRKRYTED